MCKNQTKEDSRAVFSLYIFRLLPVHIPHGIKGRPKASFGTSWSHLQVYHLQACPGLALLDMVQHLRGLRDAKESGRHRDVGGPGFKPLSLELLPYKEH